MSRSVASIITKIMSASSTMGAAIRCGVEVSGVARRPKSMMVSMPASSSCRHRASMNPHRGSMPARDHGVGGPRMPLRRSPPTGSSVGRGLAIDSHTVWALVGVDGRFATAARFGSACWEARR